MTSSRNSPIKTEEVIEIREVTISSEQPIAEIPLPKLMSPPTMEDVSKSLLSPGFSQQVLEDKVKREKLCQSLDVKNRQQDIIMQRLQSSPSFSSEEQRQLHRRAPKKLNLEGHHVRVMGPRTAPIHGSFASSSSPGHTRMRAYSRSSPYDKHEHVRYITVPTPQQAYFHGPRLGPPQGIDARSQLVTLPSLRPPTRHPITPPSDRGEGGLDTLSRAARLKAMKEDYLTACSASFDALHGMAL